MEDNKREERDEVVGSDAQDPDDVDRDASNDKKASSMSKPSASGNEPAQDEEDEEDDEDEEDEAPARKPASSAVTKAAKPVDAQAQTASQEPKAHVDPAAVRNGELRVGLGVATAGYLAFWGAWMIYSKSIDAKQVNYFSHSAWLLMIAYALVTIAAFYFVRLEPASRFPQAAGAKPSTVEPGKTKESPYRKQAEKEQTTLAPPRVDRTGVLLAAAVCGPLYAVYWYVAKSVLRAHYAQWWWVLELVAFAVVTGGAVWGLRPPSQEDERRERMPTRRALTMMMVPFLLVFGMIWLASVYPPWPS